MSLLSSAGFRVGALVVIVSAVVAYLSMELSQNMDFATEPQKFWFVAESADGLIRGGQVKMAGIPIGQVTNIRLQDGKARVDIQVEGDVPVRESASVLLQSSGILGDKHVELNPGSPSDPPLNPGQRIVIVEGAGTISTVMNQVGDISKTLKETAEVFANAIRGQGNTDDVLGRILLNMESLTSDLAKITETNQQEVTEIIDRLSSITASVDRVVSKGGQDGRGGLDAGWEKLMTSLERLEASTQNLQDITDKINSGEGTIGRLIHDESTIDEINTAVENVNSLIGGANQMETSLDFGSEYYTGVEQWKSYVGIKIQPGLDRFYLLHVVDDPTGLTETEETRITDGSGSESFRRTERTNFSEVKFTALFGKNYYNWTLLGGLYENTAGVGADYHLWDGRVKASLMAFDFATANLRASLTYQPIRGFFVRGGLNDILDNSEAFSSYFGAGILLTNDDLKLLISGSAF